jgi:hypothetical protein
VILPEAHMTTHLKEFPAKRDSSPARMSKPSSQRTWLIRRARARIASGFYDSPACIDAVVELVLASLRPPRGGRSAGRDAEAAERRSRPA